MKNGSGFSFTADSSSRSVIVSIVVLAFSLAAAVPAAFGQCSAPAAIVIQPTSQTVLADGAVTFSVRATFSSACPSTYTWQVRFPPGTEFFDLSGGYPDLLIQSPRGMNGAELRCVVSNAAGFSTSSAATLTVTSGTCTPPSITVEPQDKVVTEGNPVTLTVQAATPPAGCTLKYQWYNIPSAEDGQQTIAGATNASYTVFQNRDTQFFTYQCQIENAAGGVLSREARVDVILVGSVIKEAESVTRSSSGASTAVQNDPNTSGGHWIALLADSVNDSVSYTIPNVAAGDYTFKFRYKGNGNRGIANLTLGGISLGQLDQYSPTEVYPQNWYGPITFTSSGNKTFKMAVAGKNAASSAFTLSADQFDLEPNGPLNCTTPPVISVQPQSNITVLEGNPVTLFVDANATPSACELTYQWRYLPSVDDGEQLIPGATSRDVTIYPTRDNEDYEYDVVISNAAGSTVSQHVRLNVIRAGSLFYEAESVSRTSSGASTALQTDVNTSGGQWVALLADGIGDTVSYTLPNVPAGEYNLKMKSKMNGNRGILDILVDNVVASQAIDQYAPTPLYVETFFNQGFFNTTGSHVFKLRTIGKNAAADAFTLSADQFTLAPR